LCVRARAADRPHLQRAQRRVGVGAREDWREVAELRLAEAVGLALKLKEDGPVRRGRIVV
jgi:hypothetical protein